jgi:hypothetical protein
MSDIDFIVALAIMSIGVIGVMLAFCYFNPDSCVCHEGCAPKEYKGVPLYEVINEAEWECTHFKIVPIVVDIKEHCDSTQDCFPCGVYDECLASDTDGDGYAVIGHTNVCTEYVLVKKVEQ